MQQVWNFTSQYVKPKHVSLDILEAKMDFPWCSYRITRFNHGEEGPNFNIDIAGENLVRHRSTKGEVSCDKFYFGYSEGPSMLVRGKYWGDYSEEYHLRPDLEVDPNKHITKKDISAFDRRLLRIVKELEKKQNN